MRPLVRSKEVVCFQAARCLNLLSSPASIRIPIKALVFCYILFLALNLLNIPHIRRRFNARHKFQPDVYNSSKGDQTTWEPLKPMRVNDQTANEEVESSATKEGEHEACISRDLRRDLEFEEAGRCVVPCQCVIA